MIGYDLLTTMEKNITLTMMGFTLSVFDLIKVSDSNFSGVTSCVGSVHTE
jgi:hypothetical protein